MSSGHADSSRSPPFESGLSLSHAHTLSRSRSSVVETSLSSEDFHSVWMSILVVFSRAFGCRSTLVALALRSGIFFFFQLCFSSEKPTTKTNNKSNLAKKKKTENKEFICYAAPAPLRARTVAPAASPPARSCGRTLPEHPHCPADQLHGDRLESVHG